MRLFKNETTDAENLEITMKMMAALHMDAEKRGDDKAQIGYGFKYAGRENKWIKIIIESTSQAEAERIFEEFKERVNS